MDDQAYHQLDAYEEYIAKKRLAEDVTVADTQSLPTIRRCPTLSDERYQEELPLTWWQWIIRVAVGALLAIPTLGWTLLAAVIPPERKSGTRPPGRKLNLGQPEQYVGGPLAVTVIPQSAQSS